MNREESHQFVGKYCRILGTEREELIATIAAIDDQGWLITATGWGIDLKDVKSIEVEKEIPK